MLFQLHVFLNGMLEISHIWGISDYNVIDVNLLMINDLVYRMAPCCAIQRVKVCYMVNDGRCQCNRVLKQLFTKGQGPIK